jgi:hypothetical protein
MVELRIQLSLGWVCSRHRFSRTEDTDLHCLCVNPGYLHILLGDVLWKDVKLGTVIL